MKIDRTHSTDFFGNSTPAETRFVNPIPKSSHTGLFSRSLRAKFPRNFFKAAYSRRSLIMLFCTFPLSVFSLGMGAVNLSSFLNQPFHAEIPLLDLNGMSLEGINASLASPDDFERLGITFNDALFQLKFEVKKKAHGKPIIKVYSIDRIREPILQLVVDLTWSNGQLYRVYTLMLAPSGYRLGDQTFAFKKKSKFSHSKKSERVAIEKPIFNHKVNHSNEFIKSTRKNVTYDHVLERINPGQTILGVIH